MFWSVRGGLLYDIKRDVHCGAACRTFIHHGSDLVIYALRVHRSILVTPSVEDMIIYAIDDLVGHLECFPAEATLHLVRVNAL